MVFRISVWKNKDIFLPWTKHIFQKIFIDLNTSLNVDYQSCNKWLSTTIPSCLWDKSGTIVKVLDENQPVVSGLGVRLYSQHGKKDNEKEPLRR